MWLFGKKKSSPYTLKDKICETNGALKTILYNGVKNSDNQEYSIFEIKEDPSSPLQQALKGNLIKSWKSFRHPSIVQYVDTYEENNTTYIVTEKVEPFREEEFASGEKQWAVHSICDVISFLSGNNIIHGNLQNSAFFQTSGHELRIGGLEWATVNNVGPITQFTSDWEKISKMKYVDESVSPKYGIDCFMLSNIVREWQSDIARPVVRIAKKWQNIKQSMPEPSAMLSLEVWENDKFSQVLNFLTELPLKSNSEKEVFFKSLVECEDIFSVQMQVNTILPVLLKALSYSPTPSILQPIFSMSSQMDQKEFAQKIIPHIISLFSNNDRSLRIELLNQMPKIVPYVDNDTANNVIFKSITGGFNDTQPQVRQATIIAMVPLAPMLTNTNMRALIRYLKGLQADQDPQIRANSVICIAKIAESMDTEFRAPTLAQCFSIATKDGFTPTRKAAIAAYKNCLQHFNQVIIATSVVPSIAPLCVDAVEDVRIPTLKLMLQLADMLAENDKEKIEEETLLAEKKAQQLAKEKQQNKDNKQIKPKRKQIETGGWSDDDDSEDEKPIPTKRPAQRTNQRINRIKPVAIHKKPIKPAPKQEDINEDDDGWDDLDDEINSNEKDEKPIRKLPQKPVTTLSSKAKEKTQKVDTFDDDIDGWDDLEDDDNKKQSGNDDDGWDDFDKDDKPVPNTNNKLTTNKQKTVTSKPQVNAHKEEDDGWDNEDVIHSNGSEEKFKPVSQKPKIVHKAPIRKTPVHVIKKEKPKPAVEENAQKDDSGWDDDDWDDI